MATLKEHDKIKVHFYDNSGEIKTRNFDKVFEIYNKNGELGIDWNTELSEYINCGDIFVPFHHFANTVIFENIETGENFHFDSITKNIQVK